MKTLLLIFVPSLIAIIIAAYGGYTFALKQGSDNVVKDLSNQSVTNSADNQVKTSAQRIGPSTLIKSQQALAIGIIAAKSDSSVTVKGDNNTSGTFTLSPDLVIYPLSTSSAKAPLGTHDKSTIVLNQHAAVTLNLENNQYVVTDINYFQ